MAFSFLQLQRGKALDFGQEIGSAQQFNQQFAQQKISSLMGAEQRASQTAQGVANLSEQAQGLFQEKVGQFKEEAQSKAEQLPLNAELVVAGLPGLSETAGTILRGVAGVSSKIEEATQGVKQVVGGVKNIIAQGKEGFSKLTSGGGEGEGLLSSIKTAGGNLIEQAQAKGAEIVQGATEQLSALPGALAQEGNRVASSIMSRASGIETSQFDVFQSLGQEAGNVVGPRASAPYLSQEVELQDMASMPGRTVTFNNPVFEGARPSGVNVDDIVNQGVSEVNDAVASKIGGLQEAVAPTIENATSTLDNVTDSISTLKNGIGSLVEGGGETVGLEAGAEAVGLAIPGVGEVLAGGLALYGLYEGIKDLFSGAGPAPVAPAEEEAPAQAEPSFTSQSSGQSTISQSFQSGV